ncbi:MAG: DUF1801 domain-containing protein [Chitinophagaceae bacterium]
MKPTKPNPDGKEQVIAFLDQLEHPLLKEIRALREIILNSNNKLTEQIKWNAPSFCIDGDDFATMKLFPPKNIQLVFHRGAKVKTQPKDKLIADDSGLLKWAANDRAVATFLNMADLKEKEKALTGIVKKWIAAVKATA